MDRDLTHHYTLQMKINLSKRIVDNDDMVYGKMIDDLAVANVLKKGIDGGYFVYTG